MKMVKDKKLVVGADFAGYPLKEAVVALILMLCGLKSEAKRS